MTTLDQRISKLSPEKRALLEKYLLEKTSQTKAKQTIPRRTPAESYPLSFAQERMWFLEQLYPDSALYNEQSVYRLRGPLNIDALAQSMQTVVQRHELLRTVYRQIDGKVMQIILPAPTVNLPVLDLTALSAAEQEAEIARLAAEEARQPFDLALGPVYRTKVLGVAADEHILIQTRHHIATDGWSTAVYWGEINELYNAYCAERTPSLPELPIQYADYAIWQREWLAGEIGQQQVSYWGKQLAHLSPLNLPTDRPRLTSLNHSGGSHFFTLPTELTESLKELIRRENATLFMVLLTAFQILLHRYSGQNDIAVGSPIANRTRTEIEGLIGFFVNTLVMRSNLAGNPSFRSLLNQARQTCLDAYAHQDLPLEKLVEDLQPERHLDRHPLFQVAFVLQNAPKNPLTLTGVSAERLRLPSQASKFDMTLAMTESSGGFQAHLDYSTELFDLPTVERMATHYQILLQGIVADPDCPIGQLPLMTESERHQILVEWNDTATHYPSHQTVHGLFEEQVERTPDAVALVFGDQQWRYRQLNERSNQLAHYLRTQGVGPEVLVGVALPRSIEMIVALLGILKAGGSYVPLDADYPQERLHWLLRDTQVSMLLTQSDLVERLDGTPTKLICLDSIRAEVATEPNENPSSSATADNLIYVMYTSGSTGTPKGVGVIHRNVTRLVKESTFARLDASEIFLQSAPLSFDASTLEIWGALLNGARLVIAPSSPLSLAELGELIRSEQVTTLWLTASLFALMVDHQIEDLRGVRQLLAGGDILPMAQVKRVLRELPNCQLINGYGPTENTTFTCCFPIHSVDDSTTAVPIGRPISNTQVYILDRYLQPVPVGMPGELFAGGDGVSRGYLNRPDLTSERFVAHPFSHDPDRLLYRTGDLARYRLDGVIEFLGRADRQVKIRGFRVEPGEMEAILTKHPAVHDAVVLVTDNTPAQKELIAYIVTSSPSSALGEELRSFMQKKVPSYMVPSSFVWLDELPLNPNGKVDHRRLLEMKSPAQETRPSGDEMRDLLDAQIKAVWESLLHVRAIGLDDNFFALGGHSLLAVTLFAEIERLTGKRLPLSILFQSPTLRQLTDAIRSQDWVSPWKSLVAIQPKGHKTPLFLVPPAATTALRFANLVSHLGTDRPIYSFDSLGLDGITKPHTSVEEMAAFYLREMRMVQPTGPYLLGGMCLGAHVAFEMAQQLQAEGQEVPMLVIMDAGPPVNGPSWRRPVRTRFHYLHRLAHHLTHRTVVNGLLLPKLQIFFRRSAKAINPVTSRIQKVKDVQNEAWHHYIAQPYSGKTILFQSEMYHKRGDNQRWGEIFRHLVVYVTPGSTHRDMLTTEPYLGQWAAQLRQCLNQID